MLNWLSAGMIFTLLTVALVLLRWGGKRLNSAYPVPVWVFVAVLFTSGLDVGLIMFPLTEFPVYADTVNNPAYGFSNPLAIAFGFWGFLVWSMYFLTCFYFCAIEPRVRFFAIPWVKFANNTIIIGTCAFTAHLLFANLNWYWPDVPSGIPDDVFYAILVGVTILLAVCSSIHLRFVAILSVSSGVLFFMLVLALIGYAGMFGRASLQDFASTVPELAEYFQHIHRFALPFNDYHGFYLFWWFAWSIMIGQFTARFAGGLTTRGLFFHMLLWPSLSIAVWFCVLYVYHQNQIATQGVVNFMMMSVGLAFVVNSLDSLTRLYADNLNLTASKMGQSKYLIFHFTLLAVLCALFSLDFLQIQWVGALVIGLVFVCAGYIVIFKRRQLPDAQPLYSNQLLHNLQQ